MKNIKSIGTQGLGLCVIAFIAAMAIFSCSDTPPDDGPKNLPGTIEIYKGDEPVAEGDTVSTGTALTAEYSGTETVTYQWKLDDGNVSAELGGTSKTFTPGEPGDYTVTVSASGYKSKTSAPVTVTGSPLNVIEGDLYISDTVDGDTAITTAETGQTLYARYIGSTTGVAYQWFNGETSVTNSGTSAASRIYTPTESGSYTVTLTRSNYVPKSSDPVEVTGSTKITITFNMNGGGANQTRLITPGAEIGELPADPVRANYTFTGWFDEQTEGTEVTADTAFDEAATVWARWQYVGGTPMIDGDTLVHANPLMEQGLQFAGTISAEDGSIEYTAGAFQYKFPTTAGGVPIDISDYARFTVQFSVASGGDQGINLRQYGVNTAYGGDGTKSSFASNFNGTISLQVYGAGTTGGFSVNKGSGDAMVLSITNITFYKETVYTVTFDLDGGEGEAPEQIEIYNGFTIGNRYPGHLADPTREDYTFLGWKNENGAAVDGTTPITGNWALTAQWILTSELGTGWIERINKTGTNAPVYGFELPEGKTVADYNRIVVKIKTGTDGFIGRSGQNGNGRLRVWGPFIESEWTAEIYRDMGNAAAATDNATSRLLCSGAYDGLNIGSGGAWVTYTLPLSTANLESTLKGRSDVVFFGVGIIGQAGNTDLNNIYYIKDIVLSNSGNDPVEALKPTDVLLFAGAGADRYVAQSGEGPLTRSLLPYEDD